MVDKKDDNTVLYMVLGIVCIIIVIFVVVVVGIIIWNNIRPKQPTTPPIPGPTTSNILPILSSNETDPYDYMGCYKDDRQISKMNGGSSRGALTIDQCYAIAKQNDYQYFGLQGTNEYQQDGTGKKRISTCVLIPSDINYSEEGVPPTQMEQGINYSNCSILEDGDRYGQQNENAVYRVTL